MSDKTGTTPTSNLRPFIKGDPRINRKGRPKSFDALRREAIKIAGELLTNPASGEQVSVVHAILRGWASSGEWQAQREFIYYAYGKVPNETELSGRNGGPIETHSTFETAINHIYGNDDNDASNPPDATDDGD